MDEFYAALCRVQARLPLLRKEARGQYGAYADLADVSRAILPVLAAEGLVWTCLPTMDHGDGQLVLSYHLIHAESGHKMSGEYPLGTGGPQQLGSAITYARRYCLCAVTGLAPDDEDDDGTLAQAGQAIVEGVRRARAAGRVPAEHRDRDEVPPEPPEDGGSGDGGDSAGSVGLPPEEQPGTVDGRQRTRLQLCMRDLGIMDRDERLAEWSGLVGRPLVSGSDLSWTEAAGLLSHYEPLAMAARRERGQL